ncbi:MAG TPA: hypothetical protein VLL06_05670 [Nitrospiraceae bacterium]|nr:hypothetical protein [Nitrospiraceae bacterium]
MNRRIIVSVLAVAWVLSLHSLSVSAEGTAQGETSDEKGQQGLGLTDGSQSSNIILGGPDIVLGQIVKIQGEQFSVKGDRGQEISLRVTKDTNKICGEGAGTNVSTGQDSANEQQEIPPTSYMDQQAAQGGKVLSEQDMLKQVHEGSRALSNDPNTLKEVVGSTDPNAKEDTARGSGFMVGGRDCTFKEGDRVRIEASDMGTATTIKQLQHAMK